MASIDKSKPHADYSKRRIYIMRHGERCDFTFGGEWLKLCFTDDGKYKRFNLNMPREMPLKRKGLPEILRADTPLTEIGLYQAFLTGESMKSAGVKVSFAYCSPSLRCMQTCERLLKGLGQTSVKIRGETGLFEWPGWYPKGLPGFMSAKELQEFGIPVDPDYKERMPGKKFDMAESIQGWYRRTFQLVNDIQKIHKEEGGNILFVAHGATLDLATRMLCGREPRTTSEFYNILHQVAYCDVACAEENQKDVAGWQVVEPPVPCLSHSPNHGLDWKRLKK